MKRAKTITGKSCDICGKILYGNAGSFAHHMSSHENNKKIKCSVCEVLFTSLKFLSKHKNEQHSNLKNYAEPKTQFCEICRKEFSSRQSLKHHTIVTHTKVYPVTCDGCGKGFTGTRLGKTLEKHKQVCLESI